MSVIIHGDQKTFEETQEKKCEKMFRSSHPLWTPWPVLQYGSKIIWADGWVAAVLPWVASLVERICKIISPPSRKFQTQTRAQTHPICHPELQPLQRSTMELKVCKVGFRTIVEWVIYPDISYAHKRICDAWFPPSVADCLAYCIKLKYLNKAFCIDMGLNF